ncbi:MAG: alcohol dehydrogenase [Acidobacteriota bacterium]|nr:alcohol dehydrogenase [Acidobacteriota bacterium]
MISYRLDRFCQPLVRVARESPEPLGTEVLVQIEACGVCHSDLHLKDGFFDMGGGKRLDLAQGRALPLTLGHEIAGTVVGLGPEVREVEVGARRVVYPWIGCGGCEICTVGQEQLCSHSRALGVVRDGGFSDYVLVPHSRYLFDFGDLPITLACTYACSGLTAYSAVRKVQSRVDQQQLVIIGLGGVGFAALRLAQVLTGARVIGVDIDDATLQAAAETGAAVVNAGKEEAVKRLRSLTDGGAPAVLDFVGGEATATLGFNTLAPGGLLVLVGLFGGEMRASLPLWPLRSLTVQGSYVGSLLEMREFMKLARAERVPQIPVTERPLAHVEAVLDELRSGSVVGRIVLTP